MYTKLSELENIPPMLQAFFACLQERNTVRLVDTKVFLKKRQQKYSGAICDSGVLIALLCQSVQVTVWWSGRTLIEISGGDRGQGWGPHTMVTATTRLPALGHSGLFITLTPQPRN